MINHTPKYLLNPFVAIFFLVTSLIFISKSTAGNGEWNPVVSPGIVRIGSEDRCGIDSKKNCVLQIAIEAHGGTCQLPPVSFSIRLIDGDFRKKLHISVTGPDGKKIPVQEFSPAELLDIVGEFQGNLIGDYTVTVRIDEGCKAKCGATVAACFSFTQSEWSSGTLPFFSQDIFVGVPGRMLDFPSGAEPCVRQRLPATGDVDTLPVDLGNAVLNPSSCQSSPPIPLVDGKFKNMLLGQQIALSLNAIHDRRLQGLFLCPVMTTQRVLPGPDGILSTLDDVLDPGPDGMLGTADDPTITVTIKTGSTTVLSLIDLADRALGGATNLDLTSLQRINDDVDAINRAFSGGRVVISCSNR